MAERSVRDRKAAGPNPATPTIGDRCSGCMGGLGPSGAGFDSPVSDNRSMIWYDGIHMMTDSDDLEELHAFAERIGMSRSKFQDHLTHPHYDVWGARAKRLTVNCGSKDLLRRCRRHVHRTVWPNHCFHWQTRLTNDAVQRTNTEGEPVWSAGHAWKA